MFIVTTMNIQSIHEYLRKNAHAYTLHISLSPSHSHSLSFSFPSLTHVCLQYIVRYVNNFCHLEITVDSGHTFDAVARCVYGSVVARFYLLDDNDNPVSQFIYLVLFIMPVK